MRTLRALFAYVGGLAAALVLCTPVPPAQAFDRWSQNDDPTNCGECHGDFRDDNYISPVDDQDWGNLHNIHRNDMLDGDCEVCHGDNEFPVLLNSSTGGTGFDPISCSGCHDGPGLRLHHTNSGLTCSNSNCHTAPDPVPPRENILPPYYFSPDSAHPDKPTDPCNPAPNFPENFAGLTFALDNDGDLLYDEADPDCGAVGGVIFSDGFESGDTLAWTSEVP